MPLGSFLLGRYHLMTVMTTSCTPPMRTDDMLPDTIILDTANTMRGFRKMAEGYGEYPEFADDIAQEIIERLVNLRTAEYLIRNFVTEIRMGKHYVDDGMIQIDPVYAEAIGNLANSIYAQLRTLQAYMVDGHLPYHFHLPHVPENHAINDVMLTRTCQIPYFDEQRQYERLLAA